MSLHALAAWTVVFVGLTALALPLAATLFPRHPHRGASLAPVLAVTVLTLTGYWVGQLTFGAIAAVTGVVVLAILSAIAWRRGVRFNRDDAAVLRIPVLVFAFAFVGMLGVRFLDPGAVPAGGEKFLDLGLLAVLTRTGSLPPPDMWFAGESLRYYYGGQLAVALLAELAAVPPRYAYNLGLATFYAMLATSVYGLAAAIADRHGDPDPRLAGLVAAFLVAVGGRLATPVRLVSGVLPRSFALEHLGWVVAGIRNTPEGSFETVGDLTAWSFWNARYVVPDALHVYPSWSFLNGDLHAHLLATPYLVLAAATALAAVHSRGRHRLVLLLGALPAVTGLLGLTSTWSLPTAVGLCGVALFLAGDHPLERTWGTGTLARRELSRFAVAALATVVVAMLAILWVYPFLRYQQPVSKGIGLFPPGSTLAPLLLAHGLFLSIFAWGFWTQWSDWGALSSRGWFLGGLLVALACVGAIYADLAGLVVFVPVVALGWYLRRRGASEATTLVVAGAGILLVAELAYAKVWPHDPNAPRWNTIYKISMQAFVLWGTAAGVVLGRNLASIRDRVADGNRSPQTLGRIVLAGVLLLSAATFPAMALAEHIGGATQRENSLSATKYVDTQHPEEAAAIEWLRDDVPGTPTIVTAAGMPVYTWNSAPSALTGIPTVVGWRHEAGYHGTQAYQARVAHVETIYEADWPAAALYLDYYDVDYVYLGPVERTRYDVRRFAARPGVDIAYRDRFVTIFAVDDDAACEATNRTCPAE